MTLHYPDFPSSKSVLGSRNTTLPTVRFVNQTHWEKKYKDPYPKLGIMRPCPYYKVCQQLIKLHVFELKTDLGYNYIGDNILIVVDTGSPKCDGMDAVQFTEAITAGPSPTNSSIRSNVTHSPYLQCVRPDGRGDGLRVGQHHILFQHDIMKELHNTVTQAWKVQSLWDASNVCFQYSYCAGRVAEYLLYYAFVLENYPERIRQIPMKSGVDVMDSGVCEEEEMKCCRDKQVLLKGCHDHRLVE